MARKPRTNQKSKRRFMSNPEKPVFIYCLWCPVKRRIRYIGKSNQPEARLYLHILSAKQKYHDHHTSRWIRKLRECGKEPKLRILFKVDDGGDWRSLERSIIARALAKNWPLTNQSAGGDGVEFLTEEAFLAAKAARRAGITPEVRRRMSESMKSAWANPEIRARMRAAQKEAAMIPERRAELGKNRRTPEGEARRMAAVKAYYADPENRARHALLPNAIRFKNDPDYARQLSLKGKIARQATQKAYRKSES